jgi:hypothetical protein
MQLLVKEWVERLVKNHEATLYHEWQDHGGEG